MGTRSNRNLVTLARSISLLGCRPPRNCVSSFVQFLRLPDLFVTRRNHLTLPFVVFHWLPHTNGFVFHYRVVCWLNPEIVKFLKKKVHFLLFFLVGFSLDQRFRCKSRKCLQHARIFWKSSEKASG